MYVGRNPKSHYQENTSIKSLSVAIQIVMREQHPQLVGLIATSPSEAIQPNNLNIICTYEMISTSKQATWAIVHIPPIHKH